MRAFTASLEAQLRRAAAHQHRRKQRVKNSVRVLAAVSLSVALGVTAVETGGEDSRAAALPVLDGPAIGPADLPGDLRQTEGLGGPVGQIREFDTPYGRGFVMVSVDRERVCIAVPDKVEGFGSTCAAMSEAQRNGVDVRLLSERGSGPGELVLVLPSGATAPTVEEADGDTHSMSVSNGVAAGLFSEAVKVTYDTDDGPRRISMNPYVPEGPWYVSCGPHKRAVRIPGREALRDAQKYCEDAIAAGTR